MLNIHGDEWVSMMGGGYVFPLILGAWKWVSLVVCPPLNAFDLLQTRESLTNLLCGEAFPCNLTRRHPVHRAGVLVGLDWCTWRPEERMFGQLLSNRKESALFCGRCCTWFMVQPELLATRLIAGGYPCVNVPFQIVTWWNSHTP